MLLYVCCSHELSREIAFWIIHKLLIRYCAAAVTFRSEKSRETEFGGEGRARCVRTLLKSTDVTLMNNFLSKNRFERLPPESRFRAPAPCLSSPRRLVHLETFKRIRLRRRRNPHATIKYACITHKDTSAAPRPNGIMQKYCRWILTSVSSAIVSVRFFRPRVMRLRYNTSARGN